MAMKARYALPAFVLALALVLFLCGCDGTSQKNDATNSDPAYSTPAFWGTELWETGVNATNPATPYYKSNRIEMCSYFVCSRTNNTFADGFPRPDVKLVARELQKTEVEPNSVIEWTFKNGYSLSPSYKVYDCSTWTYVEKYGAITCPKDKGTYLIEAGLHWKKGEDYRYDAAFFAVTVK